MSLHTKISHQNASVFSQRLNLFRIFQFFRSEHLILACCLKPKKNIYIYVYIIYEGLRMESFGWFSFEEDTLEASDVTFCLSVPGLLRTRPLAARLVDPCTLERLWSVASNGQEVLQISIIKTMGPPKQTCNGQISIWWALGQNAICLLHRQTPGSFLTSGLSKPSVQKNGLVNRQISSEDG